MIRPSSPRLAALLLLPLALGGSASALPAQRLRAAPDSGIVLTHRRPRALVLGVVGTLLGGLAGFGFGRGGKQPGATMTLVGAAAGGLAGFFIGGQLDERHAAVFHGATPLKIPNVAIELAGDPSVLAVRDSVAAVGGSAGVQLFTAMDPRLLPLGIRAEGLTGIDALDLAPGAAWLALGSRAGLYLYPPTKGPGMLVRRVAINAIAASATRIFMASDNRVESLPVGADSVRSWPGITLSAPVRDLELDESRALVWASTDRELVALRITGDSLVAVGSLPLPGPGLRMAIDSGRAAVAMGEKGVAIIDVSDPAHPMMRSVWTAAQFAYDVSLDGRRMFVAAGPEGVYLVDLSRAAPRTIGLARSLGFASAIASYGGHTFILDRRGNALRRITSAY